VNTFRMNSPKRASSAQDLESLESMVSNNHHVAGKDMVLMRD
jgi:hypothetical protein